MTGVQRTWKPATLLRVGSIVIGILLAAVSASPLFDSPPPGGIYFASLGKIAILLFVAVNLASWGFRAKFVLADDYIVIANPFSKRTLPLDGVVGASGGYFGIRIELEGSRTVTASAVTKSNVARIFGHHALANEITGEIISNKNQVER